MPARLRPSPLDGARSPLALLRLRGWVHAGTLPLDGVLLDRAHLDGAHLDRNGAGGPQSGPDWRLPLLPWLEQAAEIRARGDLVLVLFAAPLVRDCAALGPCLPVLRRSGILSTAPFAEPEPDLARALRDGLVHVAEGALRSVPLSDFATLDVAGWWALDGVAIAPAERVPALRPPAPRRRLASAPLLAAEGGPFQAMRDDLARRPRRPLRRRIADAWRESRDVIGRVLRFAWSAYVVFLLLTVLGGIVAGMVESFRNGAAHSGGSPDDADWIYALIVLVAVLAIAAFAFLRRPPGSAAPVSPSVPWKLPSVLAVGAAAPRTPFWRRAAAWIAWRSPYAAHLRRLYARRLVEVERLFAEGRIEEALHRAIGLAGAPGDEGVFADLPLAGPGLRTRLTLNFGVRKGAALSLAPDDEARLHALYRKHAASLAREGEIERSAFVFDELVGSPREAIGILVEAGRIETAARLAEARRLGPSTVVPLWFRAGRTERALALAARHDAFAELWKELRPGDPFREILAEAWAERLAAVGAFDRAASVAHGVAALAERRAGWIGLALAAHRPPSPESLARALRALPWSTVEGDPVHADFAAYLADPGKGGAVRRTALAGQLLASDLEGGPPVPPTPGFALVCRGLARRLAADEGALGHHPERARLAGRLAEAGGQVALRQHLRRLGQRPAPAGAGALSSVPAEIPDGPPLAEIADVALLTGGRLLIGYRSGLVRLLGASGRERWRLQVDGLLGFATLGDGERAFVLRRTLDGPALLLLDPAAGRLVPRGLLPVSRWHSHASETGWLVFDGDGLVRLDTASLLAGPEREAGADAGPVHHWRVPVTEPGRPLALADFPEGSVLLHARDDGLFEWWGLASRTLAVTCRFWAPPPVEPGAVLGLAEGVAWALERAEAGPRLRAHPHAFTAATRQNELALIAEKAEAGIAPLPRFAAADAGRFWASSLTEEGVVWSAGATAPGPPPPAVTWHGSRELRTRFSRDGFAAAVFDERGRLVLLDPRTGRVLLRLV